MFGSWTESFDSVTTKLGNRDSRKVANNTYLVRRADDRIALRLHATDVLIFTPEYVELHTGGWYSVTTKDRQNYVTGARIFSSKGTWYVCRVGDWDNPQRYFDGIRLSYAGDVLNPLPVAETERIAEENAKTKREIAKYVKLCATKFSEGLPLPSGGDCWYCAMRTEDGTPLGDSVGNHDHLREHMREGYVVPSLLWNAVAEVGYRFPEVILSARPEGMGGSGAYMSDSVTRALRRYLKARLLTAEEGVKPAGTPRHEGGF